MPKKKPFPRHPPSAIVSRRAEGKILARRCGIKKHFGVLPVLFSAILLIGASFPACTGRATEAAAPSAVKFMQDSEDCKEIAMRPDETGATPPINSVTKTYLVCMTARGYTEDDIKARTHDDTIDFKATPKPPAVPANAPPATPPGGK
jgi:hypothetical protein